MQISLYQLMSLAGALLVLLAYASQQLGWMKPHGLVYNLCNAAGSLLLGYVALHPFQIGFVLLEFVWAGISLYAFAKAWARRTAADVHPGSPNS
jgi:hypothetical protein